VHSTPRRLQQVAVRIAAAEAATSAPPATGEAVGKGKG
jgi:hypothetical protein